MGSLRAEVMARHVEATNCGAEFDWPVRVSNKRMTCGAGEHDALHDLYPEVEKRDRLPSPLAEEHRHQYVPVGRGICAADEDDWPCAAYRLAATPEPELDVDWCAAVGTFMGVPQFCGEPRSSAWHQPGEWFKHEYEQLTIGSARNVAAPEPALRKVKHERDCYECATSDSGWCAAHAPEPAMAEIRDHVVDRDGLVWRIVRDGGMAARADFTGITSIGIETLRRELGPLNGIARLANGAER